MKYRMARLTLLTILTLIVATFAVPAAMAQVPSGTCNGSGSIPGTYSLAPDSGPGGTTATVTGSIPLTPGFWDGPAPVTDGAPVLDTSQQGGASVEIVWPDSGSGTPQTLGQFDVTVGANEAHFSGNIVIPPDAAPGPHKVELFLTGATDPNCLTFTVTQSVQQTAYTQTATSLPETGSMMIVPIIGLAVAGAGALVFAGHSFRSDSKKK